MNLVPQSELDQTQIPPSPQLTTSPFLTETKTNQPTETSFFYNDEMNKEESKPKRQKTDPNDLPEGYVCRLCTEAGHHITDCPKAGSNRKNTLPEGYVCRICNTPGHHIKDCTQSASKPKSRRGAKKGGIMIIKLGGECWFCLSNPAVETHLIVTVVEDTYLCLAKGGMVDAHLLIVPVLSN